MKSVEKLLLIGMLTVAGANFSNDKRENHLDKNVPALGYTIDPKIKPILGNLVADMITIKSLHDQRRMTARQAYEIADWILDSMDKYPENGEISKKELEIYVGEKLRELRDRELYRQLDII